MSSQIKNNLDFIFKGFFGNGERVFFQLSPYIFVEYSKDTGAIAYKYTEMPLDPFAYGDNFSNNREMFMSVIKPILAAGPHRYRTPGEVSVKIYSSRQTDPTYVFLPINFSPHVASISSEEIFTTDAGKYSASDRKEILFYAVLNDPYLFVQWFKTLQAIVNGNTTRAIITFLGGLRFNKRGDVLDEKYKNIVNDLYFIGGCSEGFTSENFFEIIREAINNNNIGVIVYLSTLVKKPFSIFSVMGREYEFDILGYLIKVINSIDTASVTGQGEHIKAVDFMMRCLRKLIREENIMPNEKLYRSIWKIKKFLTVNIRNPGETEYLDIFAEKRYLVVDKLFSNESRYKEYKNIENFVFIKVSAVSVPPTKSSEDEIYYNEVTGNTQFWSSFARKNTNPKGAINEILSRMTYSEKQLIEPLAMNKAVNETGEYFSDVVSLNQFFMNCGEILNFIKIADELEKHLRTVKTNREMAISLLPKIKSLQSIMQSKSMQLSLKYSFNETMRNVGEMRSRLIDLLREKCEEYEGLDEKFEALKELYRKIIEDEKNKTDHLLELVDKLTSGLSGLAFFNELVKDDFNWDLVMNGRTDNEKGKTDYGQKLFSVTHVSFEKFKEYCINIIQKYSELKGRPEDKAEGKPESGPEDNLDYNYLLNKARTSNNYQSLHSMMTKAKLINVTSLNLYQAFQNFILDIAVRTICHIRLKKNNNTAPMLDNEKSAEMFKLVYDEVLALSKKVSFDSLNFSFNLKNNARNLYKKLYSKKTLNDLVSEVLIREGYEQSKESYEKTLRSCVNLSLKDLRKIDTREAMDNLDSLEPIIPAKINPYTVNPDDVIIIMVTYFTESALIRNFVKNVKEERYDMSLDLWDALERGFYAHRQQLLDNLPPPPEKLADRREGFKEIFERAVPLLNDYETWAVNSLLLLDFSDFPTKDPKRIVEEIENKFKSALWDIYYKLLSGSTDDYFDLSMLTVDDYSNARFDNSKLIARFNDEKADISPIYNNNDEESSVVVSSFEEKVAGKYYNFDVVKKSILNYVKETHKKLQLVANMIGKGNLKPQVSSLSNFYNDYFSPIELQEKDLNQYFAQNMPFDMEGDDFGRTYIEKCISKIRSIFQIRKQTNKNRPSEKVSEPKRVAQKKEETVPEETTTAPAKVVTLGNILNFGPDRYKIIANKYKKGLKLTNIPFVKDTVADLPSEDDLEDYFYSSVRSSSLPQSFDDVFEAGGQRFNMFINIFLDTANGSSSENPFLKLYSIYEKLLSIKKIQEIPAYRGIEEIEQTKKNCLFIFDRLVNKYRDHKLSSES